MLREAPAIGVPALGDRAEVARLMLELRAAVRDAESAEAEAAAADLETAREKLRARLQPLVEDRRTAFEAELIEVRAEASAAIGAARRTAAAMVPRECSLVDRAAVRAPEHEPASEPAPAHVAHVAHVGIDAEAFARAFATAFAALLDERGAAWGVGVPGVSALPGPTGPAVAKPSFWTHARHPDVLLIGLATIIMMIVVAAWLA